MNRYLIILFLAASVSLPEVLQAQGISSVVVTAPDAIVVAGAQIQLQALARDNQGNPRNNDRFNFSSSNSAVITVNSSGVATAIRPGIANITASVQGSNFISPAVSLQVIPLRIDVTAASSEITVGDSLQLNATVVDANEQPITGVAVRWQITGANGFNTRAAAIDATGLLTTSGIGLMTIHAQIVYSTQSPAQVPTFEGLTQILIKARKEFKLTRLLSSVPMNRSFTLRPAYNSDPAVNESGQAAFTANLDGLGSALMLYDNGKWDMLASAGTPGPLGGYIWHFEGPPAINSRGDVLVRVGTSFSWGLMRVSKSSGPTFLLENGTSEGFSRMNFFRAGRYSINDQGDIAFIADYQLIGSTVWNTGLFVLSDQGFRYVWATLDALPSFPSDYTFDSSMFGIDNQGVVYFRVISGRNSAIYRADGSDAPTKILGTGNRVGGIAVQDVQNLAMSPNGSIAFNVIGTSNENGVVRLRRTASTLEYLSQRQVGLVMSVNDAGDTLYLADPGYEPFWGVYRWRDSATSLFRIFNGSALDGGEQPNWVKTGRITSRGESFVAFDSPDNHLLLSRVDSSSPRTLFKAGTVLSLSPNLNFEGIVPGALSGPLHIFGGGGNASIWDVGSSLRTVWAPGDRPAQGIAGWTITHASKNPSGDLYLTFSDGIMRIRNGSAEAITRFPVTDRDRATLRGPSGWWDYNNSFSANSSGAFVFNARTDSENRLELYDRGVFVPIMVQGGPSQTASPAGGRFFNISSATYRQNPVLIDERSRVLANAQVINGPSGLFLYENGQWKTAAAFLRTNIAGSIVSNCRAIHVAGNTFYALLDFTNGDSMIAQYDGETWTPLVRRFDVMPDGTNLTFLYAAFAVNRSGDLVYGGNANGEKVILRSADAVSHLVYTEMAPTEVGDFFPNQTFEFDIRDDGQIYFVGFDILGRNTVYKADRIQ